MIKGSVMSFKLPEHPENMSKEELIKMMLSMKDKIDESEKQKDAAEKKADEIKKQKDAAEKMNLILSEQLAGVRTVVTEGFEQVSVLTEEINKRVIHTDDVLSRELSEQVKFAFEELVEWI